MVCVRYRGAAEDVGDGAGGTEALSDLRSWRRSLGGYMGGWWLCWQSSGIDGCVGNVAIWTFTECGIYYLPIYRLWKYFSNFIFIHLCLPQGTRPITSALPPSPTYHSRLLELYEVLGTPRFNHACTSTIQPTLTYFCYVFRSSRQPRRPDCTACRPDWRPSCRGKFIEAPRNYSREATC